MEKYADQRLPHREIYRRQEDLVTRTSHPNAKTLSGWPPPANTIHGLHLHLSLHTFPFLLFVRGTLSFRTPCFLGVSPSSSTPYNISRSWNNIFSLVGNHRFTLWDPTPRKRSPVMHVILLQAFDTFQLLWQAVLRHSTSNLPKEMVCANWKTKVLSPNRGSVSLETLPNGSDWLISSGQK